MTTPPTDSERVTVSVCNINDGIRELQRTSHAGGYLEAHVRIARIAYRDLNALTKEQIITLIREAYDESETKIRELMPLQSTRTNAEAFTSWKCLQAR